MPDPTDPDDDITRWILRHATESDDGTALLDGLAHRLLAEGVEVCRLAFAIPSIDPGRRGVNMTWQPDSGPTMTATLHGVAGEAEFERSPIRALIDTDRFIGRWRIGSGDGCATFPLLAELRAEGGTDYLLHLVRFSPGTAMMGAGISFVTDRDGGFPEADAARLGRLVPVLGLAIFRLNLLHTLRGLLENYVGARTAGRVLAGQVRRGRGEVTAAAILLVDLKGFTAMTDHADPLRVVAWLDDHLETLGQDIGPNGGEILKFTGDGFLAVFPVLDREALPCGVCGRALEAARAALARNRTLARRRAAVGEPALEADLALHFGDVVYGNIGTADRLDFTAIGRAVNEASRIETLCDTTGRNILISDSFARRCSEPLVDLGHHALRGVATPQRLWTPPDD